MRLKNVSRVNLLPGLFKERQTVNRNYLMSLSSQALLQNFYLEAGIIMPGMQVVENPSESGLHWGWESPTCQLRGHFLGHWMSAASMLIETEHDLELEGRLRHIVSELARCQERNGNGWVGSIPEKYFDILETGVYIWSPQYTIHKTLMGLLDAYKHAGIEQALEILKKASEWHVQWITRIPEDKAWVIYEGEAGGMLEIWASLYEITREEKHMRLCKAYSGYPMFEKLLKGEDALTDNHTNASIPQAHGAAKMYEITGDDTWLSIAELFWKCAVADRPMYATGSANAGEFYIAPGRLYEALGDRNQEFCTMYNTVRLADYLYGFTGKAEYLDYIERALYNGFLAQQNKATGMPTYFLPMRPGSKKKWGTLRNDFWCCHGTMVQAQAYYPYLCYYAEDNTLTVAQYIPSQASLELNGHPVKITQSINMPYGGGLLFGAGNEGGKNRWQQSTYRTLGQNREITFKPIYEIIDEPYTIYFTIK